MLIKRTTTIERALAFMLGFGICFASTAGIEGHTQNLYGMTPEQGPRAYLPPYIKGAESLDDTKRWEYFSQVLTKHQLIGMSYDDIEALLGRGFGGREVLRYALTYHQVKNNPSGQISGLSLRISFDPKGIVKEVAIEAVWNARMLLAPSPGVQTHQARHTR